MNGLRKLNCFGLNQSCCAFHVMAIKNQLNESRGTRNIIKRITFFIIPKATIYLKYLLFLSSSNSFFTL